MASLNKCCLIGNAGKDPEIRSMGNGKEVASFSLATTDTWKDKNSGEKRDKTEWHNIVIFSPGLINLCKSYIKKGSKLYIEGALQTRKWTGNDGIEKRTTEIILQGYGCVIQMLDSRGDRDNSSRTEKPVEAKPFVPEAPMSDDVDDSIPF